MDKHAAITVVPPEALDKDTLKNLVLEFIGREGTDYGQQEVTINLKTEQVMRQIHAGDVVITYCSKTESTNLVPLAALRDLPNEDNG